MLNKVMFWVRTFTVMPIPTYAILLMLLANGTVEKLALLLLILVQVWLLAIWGVDLVLYITKGMD